MCGVTGYLAPPWQTYPRETLRKMTDAIANRGPDDVGYWVDPAQGIHLGHRRLAIVDLTAAGHQPMFSPSGRFVMVYNGEIYNPLDLRREIAAGKTIDWKGHSDTEILLAGFEAWGIKETIERAIGMFALAVWDRETRTVSLIRDRVGEKPLYFGWHGGTLIFASELKSFRLHPAFTPVVDRGALSLFLRHNYIPAPYSIYRGVEKILPGTIVTMSLSQPDPQEVTYWSAAQVARSGVADPFVGSEDEAIDGLETLLTDAVGRQMVSDVPLGAFLSGGVDSSTIVALMQAQSMVPVKTFTIGFKEKGYDEASHARAVATHLRTDHTELYVTPEQAMDVIAKLPMLYDEPFADSSQIPTHLIAGLARRTVTVSLSGDAGDELFCGYNRYQMTARMWGKLSLVPRPLRDLLGRGIRQLSPQTWNRLAVGLGLDIGGGGAGDKLHKGSAVLASESVGALYRGLVSSWHDPAMVVIDGFEPPTLLSGNEPDLTGLDQIQRMMAIDMLSYLPDDILAKVDRAAMAVSLESRLPFLDHRIVEFAWRLPQKLKLREGQTKWILRQVLHRHVPVGLIERPKMGFGVPVDTWLRGPLKGWAESLIEEERLRREGFFHPAPIRQKWSEHLSGRRNWGYQLWSVLMFQCWLEKVN